MCVSFNVLVCMCGFCNVWVCVYGGVCMYGFCNVWLCVCVGSLCVVVCMCGCVCVCVGFVMCGCAFLWVFKWLGVYVWVV